MGIGEFPQQAENRFRVTKALLADVEQYEDFFAALEKSCHESPACRRVVQIDFGR